MKLYTSSAVAQFLDISERRVRQLRDEGIIKETRSGLYDLKAAANGYIQYLRGKNAGDGSAINLNNEKAQLARLKRQKADLDLRLRQGELHKTEDIEEAFSQILSSFKAKVLSLPSKLAQELAELTSQEDTFEALKRSAEEILQELSDLNNVIRSEQEKEEQGAENGEADTGII